MNDPLEQSLKLVLLGLFSTNIYKKVNRWSPNVFNVLVVSIGLFQFCFVPFMYNGVYVTQAPKLAQDQIPVKKTGFHSYAKLWT